jgi:hypothetical protein
MELIPSEIANIEEIGNLDGSPVKRIKTRGGLTLLAGNPKGKGLTILGCGSHQAIAMHQAKKAYPSMIANLMKSEHETEETVTDISSFLPKNLYKNGFSLHSIKSDNEIVYSLSKFNKEIGKAKAELIEDSLVLSKSDTSLSKFDGFASSLIQVTARDAIENNKEYVSLNGKSFAARRMI